MARLAADVAVDLGTATTRVVVRGRGLVAEEPTVVATTGGEAVTIGEAARQMLGRAPTGTTVVQPIQGGVVADFEATERLLHALLRSASPRSLLRPRLLVCVPAETTEVERRAVQDSARSAGAREVYLVAAPMAAAIGAGLPVLEPVGSMILDIGAGQTEVAVISLGGMVVRQSVRVAGDAMDEALTHWLRSRKNLVIGAQAARELKHAIGSALPSSRPQAQRVRGRDLATGKPREVEVRSDDIAAAFAEPVARIRDAVLDLLARTPPELSSDIIDRGVILCGGTSRLPGLDRVLREATGLPILGAEHPLHCAALGAGALLEDGALFERVAMT